MIDGLDGDDAGSRSKNPARVWLAVQPFEPDQQGTARNDGHAPASWGVHGRTRPARELPDTSRPTAVGCATGSIIGRAATTRHPCPGALASIPTGGGGESAHAEVSDAVDGPASVTGAC
jgi:hypothetical protein